MNDENKLLSIKLEASKATVFVSAGLILFIGVISYFTVWPHYVMIEPPLPEGVFTSYEEKATLVWYSGSPGYPASKSFIWQKQFIVGLNCCEDLNSREEIFTYLDSWLSEQGWKRWEEVGSPCSHLAEGEFLERGKDYGPYIPQGRTSLTNTPAVCVAVWPFSDLDFEQIIGYVPT
jgi:hypothetical protein